jgi:hypothetical protein
MRGERVRDCAVPVVPPLKDNDQDAAMGCLFVIRHPGDHVEVIPFEGNETTLLGGRPRKLGLIRGRQGTTFVGTDDVNAEGPGRHGDGRVQVFIQVVSRQLLPVHAGSVQLRSVAVRPPGGGVPDGSRLDVIARRVRGVDGPPANVLRRDVVREPSAAADHATEPGLGRAVGFGRMPTDRTALRGIARIHEDHGHPRPLGLVGHESPELGERPGMQRGPLRPENRDPLAEPLEILQGDRPAGVFGRGHEGLADHVIHVGLEAAFLPASEPEQPLGRPGALRLETLPEPAMPMAETQDLGARVAGTVGVHGEVPDPQIDAQNGGGFEELRFLHFAGGQEVEGALSVPEVGLPALVRQEGLLPWTADEPNSLPAREGPERHGLRLQVPGQQARIVRDAPAGLERPLTSVPRLGRIGHFPDGADGQLGAQVEALPEVPVDQVVEANLAEGLGLPGDPTRERTGGIRGPEGPVEEHLLLRGGCELHLRCQFHDHEYTKRPYGFQAHEEDTVVRPSSLASRRGCPGLENLGENLRILEGSEGRSLLQVFGL